MISFMQSEISKLPDDPGSLKKIILSLNTSHSSIKEENHGYKEHIHSLEEENNFLREQIRFFKARLFGRKSEKLDIIPAKIRVERHIRYKYACKSCDGLESGPGTVRTAMLPPQIIPQGIATAGLVSHITSTVKRNSLSESASN